MRRQLVVVAAMILACGAASSQTVENDYRPEPSAFDLAWESGREPYRGHYPFAVAGFSPFAAKDWFVVSIFSFWTGYIDTNDARQHWVVRRVSGRYEGYDADGRFGAEQPAIAEYALSDSCPAMERAIARFELHERPVFSGEGPKYSREVVISSYDASWLYFWARLRTAEIQLSTSDYNSGVSAWVFETLDAIAGCFSDVAPDVPIAAHPDYHLDRPPAGIFARWWEEGEAERQ